MITEKKKDASAKRMESKEADKFVEQEKKRYVIENQHKVDKIKKEDMMRSTKMSWLSDSLQKTAKCNHVNKVKAIYLQKYEHQKVLKLLKDEEEKLMKQAQISNLKASEMGKKLKDV